MTTMMPTMIFSHLILQSDISFGNMEIIMPSFIHKQTLVHTKWSIHSTFDAIYRVYYVFVYGTYTLKRIINL